MRRSELSRSGIGSPACNPSAAARQRAVQRCRRNAPNQPTARRALSRNRGAIVDRQNIGSLSAK